MMNSKSDREQKLKCNTPKHKHVPCTKYRRQQKHPAKAVKSTTDG